MNIINHLLSKFVIWYLNLPKVKNSNFLLEPVKEFLRREDNSEKLSNGFLYCFGDLTAMNHPHKVWSERAKEYLIDKL